MNTRLKQIRLSLNLSQEEFGKRIGIKSRAHISSLESGTRNITDRIISDLCKEFNVNENWLRTGNGEMFIKKDTISLDEYAKSKNLSDLDLTIIRAYMDIDKETRKALLSKIGEAISISHNSNTSISFLNALYNDGTHDVSSNEPNITESVIDVSNNDNAISQELARYKAELEAEKKGKTLSTLEEQESKHA